jgi:hypothetical protein
VPVIVNADQFDTSIGSVQLVVNGTNSTLLTSTPFETTLGLPAGHYSLTAQAADAAELMNTSAPVEFDVIKAGGSLSGTFSQLAAGASVDMTNEGTENWTFFSPTTNGGNQITRKAGVLSEISQPSVISTSPLSHGSWVNRNSDGETGFSFEDGTPDPSESNIEPTGEWYSGSSSVELQLTAPADMTLRTLRLYLLGCGCNVQMSAFLGDGSASPIVDNSLNSNIYENTNTPGVYTIAYSAASAGQTLTIQLSASNLFLIGATLNGTEPATLAVPVVSSISPASGIAGTRVTITGSDFGVSQGTSFITFNGAQARVLGWSDSQILAVAPAGVESGSVEVVSAGGTSNGNVEFTIAPLLLNIEPSAGPVGSTVTINGSGFGSYQGSGTVTFNGVLASPSAWGDGQIVVTVPAGASTGPIVVSQNAPATSTPLFTVSSAPLTAKPPMLQVRLQDSPFSVNLSDPVNQDWIIWASETNAVRMAGGNLIGALTPLQGTQLARGGDFQGGQTTGMLFSWTNGSPTPAMSDVSAGIFSSIHSAGQGVALSAPADTTVRTLMIYSSYTGNCQLIATISDGSSAPVTFTPASVNDYGYKTYLIDYRAASPGQMLTVQLVTTNAANNPILDVEAAVLRPHLPEIAIVSPARGMVVAPSTIVPLSMDALQYDASISGVIEYANGTALSTISDSSQVTNWTPAQGHYTLQAQAADAAGLINLSQPVAVDVVGAGGQLSLTRSVPPSTPIDLTAIGTADWIMFAQGGTSTSPTVTLVPVRKAGVTPLISAETAIGDMPLQDVGSAYSGSPFAAGFAFNDGTPDNIESNAAAYPFIYNGVPGGGFKFTVAADTTPRTLQLYGNAENAGGK